MTEKNIDWLTEKPIAHRALHNKKEQLIENSLSAVKAAIKAGYPIEVDLQFSRDKVAMVFHDPSLERLTNETGDTRNWPSQKLNQITLSGSDDTIPTLGDLLELVDGKIGIVIEVKGVNGMDDGFMAAVLNDLQKYTGNVAIMSFDHWLLKDLFELDCPYPVGLVAEGGESSFATHKQAMALGNIDFVSYGIGDLPNAFISDLREGGTPIICWTIRDQETANRAYQYTDQITFEGFDPLG